MHGPFGVAGAWAASAAVGDRIKIDAVKDEVPTLRLKHVTVWDQDRLHPSYGYLYPYTYGYAGYYGYPLRW